ncbi:NIPSNAP family protein [Yinghuangia aomiensis]
MIYRMRTYQAVPDHLEAFHAFFRDHLLPVRKRHGARLVGRWQTDDARVVAVWEYDDRAAHDRIDAAVRADPDTRTALQLRRTLPELFTSVEEVFMTDTTTHRLLPHPRTPAAHGTEPGLGTGPSPGVLPIRGLRIRTSFWRVAGTMLLLTSAPLLNAVLPGSNLHAWARWPLIATEAAFFAFLAVWTATHHVTANAAGIRIRKLRTVLDIPYADLAAVYAPTVTTKGRPANPVLGFRHRDGRSAWLNLALVPRARLWALIDMIATTAPDGTVVDDDRMRRVLHLAGEPAPHA